MRDRHELLRRIVGVIEEYEGTGQRLTVRQIHYRLVSQGWAQYPNTESSYNWLKRILLDARDDGAVPWEAIEDRTRTIHDGHGAERLAGDFFESAYEAFRRLDECYDLPKWWGQDYRVQVWLEKQALEGVFLTITEQEGVDLMVLRGYSSGTQVWEDSQRLSEPIENGQNVVILYFGDFDPSGMDIQRAAVARMTEKFNLDVVCVRVALTKEQVVEWKLIPAPAKKGDSRRTGFIAEHGVDWQVEMDAIEPRFLEDLVRASIRAYWDKEQGQAKDQELEVRRRGIRRKVLEVLG